MSTEGRQYSCNRYQIVHKSTPFLHIFISQSPKIHGNYINVHNYIFQGQYTLHIEMSWDPGMIKGMLPGEHLVVYESLLFIWKMESAG